MENTAELPYCLPLVIARSERDSFTTFGTGFAIPSKGAKLWDCFTLPGFAMTGG